MKWNETNEFVALLVGDIVCLHPMNHHVDQKEYDAGIHIFYWSLLHEQ